MTKIDNFRKEDLKNEDKLKNEDDPNYEDEPKNEEEPKNEDDLNREAWKIEKVDQSVPVSFWIMEWKLSIANYKHDSVPPLYSARDPAWRASWQTVYE